MSGSKAASAGRQRTQLINALHGLLAEHGWVAPKGLFHIAGMMKRIEDQACGLPERARSGAVVLHSSRRGAPAGSWLDQMVGRKPPMLDRSRRDRIERTSAFHHAIQACLG